MTHGLPPGPRLPMPVQTLLAVLSAERYTRWCRRRFGPVVTLRVIGLGEFVSVSDPALIRTLFTADPEVVRAGEANQRIGTFARSSVVFADGERHLRLRRLLLPPFHGEAIRRHEEAIRAAAAAEVDRWPVGKPFATLPRMQAITLEVILQAVLGVRDPGRAERLRKVLPGVLEVSLLALLAESTYPRLFNGPLGSRLPWMRARREAERLLAEEIADHRADPEGREDILAMLLAARGEDGDALGDDEVRDQVFTLLVAGHETTATTLAWAFERLVRHPEWLAWASEVGDDRLAAVIDETLRVRPVVDQVARRVSEPFDLGPHRLPAGTDVAPSILGVQLDDERYPQAERFRPDRFLGASPEPYTLIPFGGGAHRCIGASFARMEMRTILRTVLERVELAPSAARPERPTRARRFTTVPSRGGVVTVAGPRSSRAGSKAGSLARSFV